MGVKFVLAVYFLRRYSYTKGRIPLVWGTGFFFFGLSQVPVLSMRYFQDPYTNMYFAFLAASLAALSLALLYYGSALLYFKKGSFMREKLTIIFFVIMIAVVLMFPFIFSPETVLKPLFVVVSSGFIFPMLFIVTIIFFVIWRRLAPDNPRRTGVLLVAGALLIYSVASGITSTYFGLHFDWIFSILCIISFLTLLYGMILGKATGH